MITHPAQKAYEDAMRGWVKWDGGGRPVNGSTMVQVMFSGIEPSKTGWADQFLPHQWHGRGEADDIVAYRIVGDQPATNGPTTADAINHPSHYTDGGIETIDYIRAKLSAEGFRAYCLGNVLKYVSRAGKKGDATEDLKKAKVYLEWAIND